MHHRSVITDAMNIERSWQANRPDGDAIITPFMPFPMFGFIAMLAEAMPEIRGGRFLDIGSGPGAKMLVAASLFGLDVRGFDISEPMAQYARSIGLNVEQADAMNYDHYHEADLVWFHRVFRHPGAEAALEAKLWPQIAPGTVVICANLEHAPPSSWFIVLDDMEIRRGIWSKPMLQG